MCASEQAERSRIVECLKLLVEFTNGDQPGVRLTKATPLRCKGANVSRRLEGGPQQGG